MKAERIRELLASSSLRSQERVTLWDKVHTVFDCGGVEEVDVFINNLADSLEKKADMHSSKLRNKLGVNNADDEIA